MSQKMNKLQIRAELLNAIKFIENGQKHSFDFLLSVVSPLKEIEDKDTILDIIIKEIISNKNDERFYILSFLLEQLIPKEKLENELWKLLAQSDINDAVKSNIINVLKSLGNQINYEKYSDYFEDPNSVIDADTEKLLKNALSNPEVLIDFLDFIEALTIDDKTVLIDSISEDYKGDELANLFAPVIYSNPNNELCKYAIKRLGESKSGLAIGPLEYAMKYSKDDDIKSTAKKSLVALKLAGIRENTEKEFFEQIYSDSEIDDAYISLPDGKGNVGLIVGRKSNDKDIISMFAVVLNNANGIIDCFGFNSITQQEYSKIVNKFYQNQEKICIPAYIAKMLFEYAENISREVSDRISYEYVCWRRLVADVPVLSYALDTVLEKRVENIDININDLRKIYSTTILDKWFFYNLDNQEFSMLANDIVEILNTTEDTGWVEHFVKKLNEYKDKIWTEKNIKQLDFRLLLTAYLLSLNGFQSYANILNSIRYNQEVKNELLINILRISIYEFLLREREKYLNTNISTNIFSRRNEANKCLVDKKILNAALIMLETEWGF